VREIEENVKVRQIITPLPHFDTLFSLDEAKTREKENNKKNLIKAIFTTKLFERKTSPV
jgi:hypothetical protein